MKNEELKQILNQIKKYNLAKAFETEDDIKAWLFNLNEKQIKNLISLNIDINEINYPAYILTDLNMLNCDDYEKRIKALSALKNGEGCWHLFDSLLKPNFLQSDRYYQDIEMLSKADTARYGLWVIGEDDFINSPYHTEDLKLIVETHNVKKDKPLGFIVSDALAAVAGNKDSINSPYHQADMNLIAKSGSDSLQMSGSFPGHSLNYLAINKVLLNDKYHLENMKILSSNPVGSEFLFIIMTEPSIIKGKNYRKEVEALATAKSINTARAIYYYIVNPDRKFRQDMDFLEDCEIDYINDAHIVTKNSVPGNKTPNYIQNLDTINEISDKFIMHYVSLLMNFDFINSEFMNYDLELLKNTSDVGIFMDLYKFITDETSLKNPFHKMDMELLSKTSDPEIRKLLLEKMIDEYSLKSQNRNFDLKYICSLNIDSIDKNILKQMFHYLFTPAGIDAKNHQEALNNLYQGIYVKSTDTISNYLDTLEQQLNDSNNDLIENNNSNKKSKILSLFKKKNK